MNPVDILIRFLNLVLGIPAFLWDGSDRQLGEISQRVCLRKEVQPMLQPGTLKGLLRRLQPYVIYELPDALGVRIQLFRFGEERILAGPYVEEAWRDESGEEILARLGLSAEWLMSYKLYYCACHRLDSAVIFRIVTAALGAVEPSFPPYVQERLAGARGKLVRETIYHEEPPDVDEVARRYEMGDQLIALVEEGKTEEVVKLNRQMDLMPQNEMFSSRMLQSAQTVAVALRALLRRAACRSGVHPVVVNAASDDFAQQATVARCVEEVRKITDRMLIEYTQMIRIVRAEQYSVPVRGVTDWINMNLSRDLDREQLSRFSGFSVSHPSHVFKKETGQSLIEYIAGKRCEKATAMLQNTGLSIQEISAHVGCLDNNYFTKGYRRFTGITPGEMRKNRIRRVKRI